MKEWIPEAIDDQFEAYLDALQKMLQIESVESSALPNAPFGKGPRDALEQALSIARAWGFHTVLVDNAVGYAEWINDSTTNNYVGVLGHVDVVPAGTGWSYHPFDMTIVNGVVYGRGVLDNKGPVMAALFAAKLLKDSGQVFKKNLRVMFGTNEETGSKDLPFYLSKEQPPIYGFTPDSQFPAVYAEKGVVGIRFKTLFSAGDLDGLMTIRGDFISSSVPDKVVFIFANGTEKVFYGKRAPSNEPQLGKNAITMAADNLKNHSTLSPEVQAFFNWISSTFHSKHYGEGLTSINGLDIADMDIQITPYKMQLKKNQLILEVSLRYSIDNTEEQIITLIEENNFKSTIFEVIRSIPPKIFNQNHPMLKEMKRIYEEVTGLNGTPIVTTGATYARFMPNIIAFGPSFPGQIGIAHNSDEYMYVDDLKRNIKIYELTLQEMLQ